MKTPARQHTRRLLHLAADPGKPQAVEDAMLIAVEQRDAEHTRETATEIARLTTALDDARRVTRSALEMVRPAFEHLRSCTDHSMEARLREDLADARRILANAHGPSCICVHCDAGRAALTPPALPPTPQGKEQDADWDQAMRLSRRLAVLTGYDPGAETWAALPPDTGRPPPAWNCMACGHPWTPGSACEVPRCRCGHRGPPETAKEQP